jgi:hypothetical protein
MRLKLLIYKGSMVYIKPIAVFITFVVTSIVADLPIENAWFDIFWGYIFFCVFVAGMPEPDETTGTVYNWAYHSFHMLAIIPVRVVRRKIEADK